MTNINIIKIIYMPRATSDICYTSECIINLELGRFRKEQFERFAYFGTKQFNLNGMVSVTGNFNLNFYSSEVSKEFSNFIAEEFKNILIAEWLFQLNDKN